MHDEHDELDTSPERQWWYETLAQQTVEVLKRRAIEAYYVPTGKEAFKKVFELIPPEATVGWGDSTTLMQIGVYDELVRTKQDKFFNAFARKPNGDLIYKQQERVKIMRQSAMADVFLSGFNAITRDGRIVSTDRTGNRVAPAIFGPRRVILVSGANKIVNNLDEAFDRIKQAAMLNIKRHVRLHGLTRMGELPCVKRGACSDCFHEQRLCHYTIIIEGQMAQSWDPENQNRIHVILIGEELGL